MDSRQISLTTPAPTNTKGVVLDYHAITEEAFISSIDSELTKVEHFTLRKVMQLRNILDDIERKIKEETFHMDEESIDGLQRLADDVATKFLTLEKYVNINFMGFHKILKKHESNIVALCIT